MSGGGGGGGSPVPVLVVVMGVSGCGKTRVGELLANQLSLPFIDGDELHSKENILKMKSGERHLSWKYTELFDTYI
jgi:uridine kinase